MELHGMVLTRTLISLVIALQLVQHRGTIEYSFDTNGGRADGITDNSPALQTLINNALEGSEIRFGRGTYCFSSRVTISKPGMRFVGLSELDTILTACSSSDVLYVTGNNFHLTTVSIDNINSSSRFLYFNGESLFVRDVVSNYTKGFSTAEFQLGADGDNAIDVHFTDVKFTAHNTPTSVNAIDIWAANVTAMTEERVLHQDANIGLQVGTSLSTAVVSVNSPYCVATTNLQSVCYVLTNSDGFSLVGGNAIVRNKNNRIVRIDKTNGAVSLLANSINGAGQMDYAFEVTAPLGGPLMVSGNSAYRMNKYLLKCTSGGSLATIQANSVPTPGLGVMDPVGAC